MLFDSNTFNTENMAVPHRAVLPILMRDGILLTRLVVGTGVHIRGGIRWQQIDNPCECLCQCPGSWDHEVPHVVGGTFVHVSGCVR